MTNDDPMDWYHDGVGHGMESRQHEIDELTRDRNKWAWRAGITTGTLLRVKDILKNGTQDVSYVIAIIDDLMKHLQGDTDVENHPGVDD